jgi:hypothetical protein
MKQWQRTGSKGAQVGLASSTPLQEVVARGHPDLAACSSRTWAEPSTWPAGCRLRRTPLMSHRLAIGQALQRDVAQARAQHAGAVGLAR